MLFYYIRHGDPTYHPDDLTPLGLRQAEAIGRRLARYGVDRIFASSAVRAQKTAQPTSELCRRPIETLDWCEEGHAYHEMTVINEKGERKWCSTVPSLVRMFNLPEVVALGEKWYEYPGVPKNHFKDGVERVNREVDNLFLSLGYQHDRENRCFIPVAPTDDRIALFAHYGFGMLFFSALLDIPYPIVASRFDQTCSGLSVIEFREAEGRVYPRLLELSCDAHLYHADIATKYNNKYFF